YQITGILHFVPIIFDNRQFCQVFLQLVRLFASFFFGNLFVNLLIKHRFLLISLHLIDLLLQFWESLNFLLCFLKIPHAIMLFYRLKEVFYCFIVRTHTPVAKSFSKALAVSSSLQITNKVSAPATVPIISGISLLSIKLAKTSASPRLV